MAADATPRRFRKLDTQSILGRVVPVASGVPSRALGLSLLHRERAGEGLLIPRCRTVHTFWMRFPLDLLFLDSAGAIVALHRGVGPRRIVRCRGAATVLELPSPDPITLITA